MAFTSNASREPSRFEYQLALQKPAQCTGANNGTARKQRLDADTQWSNVGAQTVAYRRADDAADVVRGANAVHVHVHLPNQLGCLVA